MFEISTSTAYNKTVVASFDSFDDAVAYAHGHFAIVDFEVDADVDYPAADFFTAGGEVYSINPKGV